jgi:hypothetical protein
VHILRQHHIPIDPSLIHQSVLHTHNFGDNRRDVCLCYVSTQGGHYGIMCNTGPHTDLPDLAMNDFNLIALVGS